MTFASPRPQRRPAGAVATIIAVFAAVSLVLAVGPTAPADAADGNSPSAVCGDLQVLTAFEGMFQSTSVGEQFSQDGVTLTVTEVKDANESGQGEALAVSWASDTPVDEVVLKAATDNFSSGDLDEATDGAIASGNDRGISRVLFCFDEDETETGAAEGSDETETAENENQDTDEGSDDAADEGSDEAANENEGSDEAADENEGSDEAADEGSDEAANENAGNDDAANDDQGNDDAANENANNDNANEGNQDSPGTPPREVCDELEVLTVFEGMFQSTSVGEQFSKDGVTLTVTQLKDENASGQGEALAVSWTSTTPVDEVVLKAATDNFSSGDLDEATDGAIASGNDRGISRVVFCFDEDQTDTGGSETDTGDNDTDTGDNETDTGDTGTDTGDTVTDTDDTDTGNETVDAGTETAADDVTVDLPETAVLGVTLEREEPTAAAADDTVRVAGATDQRVAGEQLPRTGANPLLPAAFAAGLIGLGALLLRRERGTAGVTA